MSTTSKTTALSLAALVFSFGLMKQSHALPDLDQDGYIWPTDCAPRNASIHPGAPEKCDDIDSDCDGQDTTTIDLWEYIVERGENMFPIEEEDGVAYFATTFQNAWIYVQDHEELMGTDMRYYLSYYMSGPNQDMLMASFSLAQEGQSYRNVEVDNFPTWYELKYSEGSTVLLRDRSVATPYVQEVSLMLSTDYATAEPDNADELLMVTPINMDYVSYLNFFFYGTGVQDDSVQNVYGIGLRTCALP